MSIPTRHFFQSTYWARFQQALDKEVIQKSGPGWSYMAVVEKRKGLVGMLHNRLYAPYGPTADTDESLQAAISDMTREAKSRKLTYVRVEPIVKELTGGLRKLGAVRNSRDYQPSLTHCIDLNRSEAELLHDMSGTNRNLWNTHARKGITFRKSYDAKDIDVLLQMLHEVAKRNGIIQHDDAYFKALAKTLFPDKAAGLVLGEYGGKPIVASLFYDDVEAGVRYYAYAGSFDAARKLQANSPLVTYLMHDAKTSGLHILDLYGVSPADDTAHRWAGHSKFKRSFGGYDTAYLGTWEMPVRPFLFRLMRLARVLL